VMMTAVSFIIGVLPQFLGPPAASHSPPHKRTKLFTANLVGTLVVIFLIHPQLVVLHSHRPTGPRRKIQK
ncbi:hypothetical protein ACVGXN_04200, partial [Enterobacter hormaechei]